jgi:hypothetical protein
MAYRRKTNIAVGKSRRSSAPKRERASKQQKLVDVEVDEITYIPEEGDPIWARWNGIEFKAHVPVKLSRKHAYDVPMPTQHTLADGTIVTKHVEKRVSMVEIAKGNPKFSVNGEAPAKKREDESRVPTNSEEYRGYAIAGSRQRAPRQLSLSDVDHIVEKLSLIHVNTEKRHQLLSDLNEALAQYAFEAGYEDILTPKQLRRQLDALHVCLKRLLIRLPRSNDSTVSQSERQRQEATRLFNTLSQIGEAYAKQHGPHPGIEPRELPRVKLPDLDEEGVYFRSSRVVETLIKTTEQVADWMNDYDEAVVPKVTWKRLENSLGRTRSAYVRLIGKHLPAIYEKHFEPLRRSSSDRVTGKRFYQRSAQFISRVMERANVGTKSGRLTLDTIEQYWKRMRADEPFEMVQPLGRGWTAQPEAQHFPPNWTDNLD